MEPGDADAAAGDVDHIAREIMDYLHLNPTASDTLEGIVQWWLRDSDTHVTIAQRALDLLIENKKVVAVKRAGGDIYYALNRKD